MVYSAERRQYTNLRRKCPMPLHDPVPYTIAPQDEHNTALLANVHPPQWVNPVPAGRYNVVVIGGGTAGLVSAAICAALGAKVALVEKHGLGGDCLITGCVPSKALLRAARAAAACRDAVGFGVPPAGDPTPDFGAVMARVRALRAGISAHDSAQRFTGLGVDVFLGEARFTGRDRIEVGETALRFKKAIIATGARALLPAIAGLAEADPLTNETLFTLTERPSRLVILGAGPIGCEMAQAFQRLGGQVTLLDSAPRILPREDTAASAVLEAVLRREGVDLRLGAEVTHVVPGDGQHTVHLRRNGAEETVLASRILVGVGRVPHVEALNLAAAGVAFDPKTGVQVNDALQTTNRHIFAAGDVCSRFQFTHSADFAARIAVQNALFPMLPKKKFSDLVIPWCTYTDPEIAHVGAYEQDLAKRAIPHETIEVPLAEVDRAILDSATAGFLKVHVSPRGHILGATVVGPHAGDIISEVTLAMTAKLPLSAIGGTIHPYPTYADGLRKAADAFNRKRLTPQRKRVLSWIFARMR
jgi:pyruvate/2-oxoglutarate dehydrogenase complex dihydrolipoamide dehydrogenase (E3) component